MAGKATVDIWWEGRHHVLPFGNLDIGDLSTDREIKDAVADKLGIDRGALAQFAVLRLRRDRFFLRLPLAVHLRRLDGWLRRLDARFSALMERLVRCLVRVATVLSRPVVWCARGFAWAGRALCRLLSLILRPVVAVLAAANKLVDAMLEATGKGLTAILSPVVRWLACAWPMLRKRLAAALSAFERGAEMLDKWAEACINWLAGWIASGLRLLACVLRACQSVLLIVGRAFGSVLVRPLLEACRRARESHLWRYLRLRISRASRALKHVMQLIHAWIYGVVERIVTGQTAAERERDHRLAMFDSLLTTPHRDLQRIHPLHQHLAQQDPPFYVHLAAWYARHGEVRDHTEMFVVTLVLSDIEQHRETGLALLRALPPYQVGRVVDFIRGCRRRDGRGRQQRYGLFRNPPRSLRTEVERYLRAREADDNAFDGAVLAARATLKRLYSTLHIKPGARAQAILFDDTPPDRSRPWAVKQLAHTTDAVEQARLVREYRIPYRVASTLLREVTPSVVEAMLGQMSPQEVINHLGALGRKGALQDPAIRALLEGKLEKAKTDSRVSAFKAEQAATAAGLDADWEARLKTITEAQLKQYGRLRQSTALLVDASASMEQCLEVGKRIGSMLALLADAPLVVYTFNTVATPLEPAARDLASWEQAFAAVSAQGSTSGGAPLLEMMRRGQSAEQIIMVTDGRENNTPRFIAALRLYRRRVLAGVSVCFVKMPDSVATLETQCHHQKVLCTSFQFNGDYYSLPNLLPLVTRPSRIALLMEIMETPLPTRAGRVGPGGEVPSV